MNTRVAASSMTLGGMMKHLALVEEYWFRVNLLGEDLAEQWAPLDSSGDKDWEWHSAVQDSPEALRHIWEQSAHRSRQALDRALSDGDLGRPARRAFQDGRSPSLRWILVHMMEEYARHNGHADLIRESVDGSTGE